MAKTKWQFYIWQPKDFWSDYRVNGVPGISLAILRVMHDLLWMEREKCLPDDKDTHKRLRISYEQWKEARTHLQAAGLLIFDEGLITSPHILEYWEECRKIAAIRKGNMEEINEKRKIAKPRLVKDNT